MNAASAVTLIAYGAFLVRLLVFKGELLNTKFLMIKFAGSNTGETNLFPFKTIGPYLLGEPHWSIAIINLVGNIALFAPIGFLVPLVYRRATLRQTLVFAVALSLVIEAMQAAFRVGIFDVDDVILNSLGGVTGYLISTQRRNDQSVRGGNR